MFCANVEQKDKKISTNRNRAEASGKSRLFGSVLFLFERCDASPGKPNQPGGKGGDRRGCVIRRADGGNSIVTEEAREKPCETFARLVAFSGAILAEC